jgi:hypothetical protein
MNLIETEADAGLVALTVRELEILRSALREASEALQDWEFETRMGCTREELRALASQVHSAESSLARRPAR